MRCCSSRRTRETVNALFGQVRTTRDLLRKATLTAGVRYNAPSAGESHTIWNVSGRYDFTDSLFARGDVGTSFRYPDAYELFAIDPTCCFGNPDLKPESSTNVNALDRRTPRSAGCATVDLEVDRLLPQGRRTSSSTWTTAQDSGNTITANSDNAVRVHGFSFVGIGVAEPARCRHRSATPTRRRSKGTSWPAATARSRACPRIA